MSARSLWRWELSDGRYRNDFYRGNPDIKTDLERCPKCTERKSKKSNKDGRVTYSCICPTGYEWTAGTCLDMNECSLGPCPDGEPCMNTVGSYQCGFDVDDSS